MGLTGKILLFIATLVVLLVGGTLAFTTVQADRLARATIDAGLKETRDVWQTIQADRFNKLRLGVRVLANDPYFKAAISERDQNTTLDSLGERGQDLAADFMMATDPAGKLIARTDRPSDTGDDFSADPIVKRALEGEDSASLWLQGDQLFTAVAVPMQTGPELVGVLVAGYRLSEAVASQIHKLTHSDIAFLVRPRGAPEKLAVSSLGPSEPALVAALALPAMAQADAPFEIDLAGERHIGIRIPLKSAARRGRRRGAGAAQPVRRDGPVPPLPQHPDRRLAGRDAARPAGRVGRRGAHHGAGAQAGADSSSGSATAPTRARWPSRAATRSASWRAPSTRSWPTCARRTR